MKKIAPMLFTAMMLASSYASADTLCKAGKIDKIETDTSGNLVVVIADGSYAFNAKEFFPIIYSAYNDNRNFFVYGNGCANGTVATRFAIR
ncbi:hypothetical protein WI73_18260 [Burkholderia ubonensis]|uniref:Uncharacterized protein n=1 Tax=Burkholderia ubonensis TaxID=101571 RepID=A0A124KTQ9_9BURK|nr:hypothetical protein [Burkholderia ubonensis]AOI70521.1 hypothetical protein WI31_13770 [Burkholderia ubonensis]AOJ62804.1 hypothetical protein WJ32_10275 [Burkholderia ubonensis]KUZ12803.1 hypothetical protein WI29_24990 [Burkholderia ubonensis]KUZ34015.1 hypothetical protein WI32_18050 [Burkholderia ubonensis]KUZ37667.1 hypothetical protein WI30_07130 [Burkholderia ubonensis]